MATATQISTRALKRLGVLASGATASAEDVSDCTEELNAIINSYEADGLSGDVLPLDARFEAALIDILAVRMADFFGRAPSPLLLADAKRGDAQIRAAFFAVPESAFDRALTVGTLAGVDELTPSGSGAELRTWEASTAYRLRQLIVYNSAIYECVEAGTSASDAGPSGTAAEITDGTAVWCFRRVVGDGYGATTSSDDVA